MHDDTAQQIQDIYDTLPQEIKDVLSSKETGTKLEAISKEHGLHIDQAADLSDLTSMVMLGIISPDEFVKDIQNNVRVSSSEATKIADEINEQILRDIKSSLIKLYKDNNLENPEELEAVEKPIEDYSTLNAGDILQEIENPLPNTPEKSTSPASSYTPSPIVPPKPASLYETALKQARALVEGTGENLLPGHPEPTLIQSATPSTPVEQKLTQIVRTPEPKKIELAPKPVSKLPPITPKSQPLRNTASDPYREPIA